MTKWQRFKCWIGCHSYIFIKYHHFYPGDRGGDLKCTCCGKEKVTNGIPPM